MADALITELIIDAKLANAGAAEFEQAARKIEASSARAAATVDALGQSIDRTSARMAQFGRGSGASAFDSQIAGVAKLQAALKELTDQTEQIIRKTQSGAFNVYDAETALGSIATIRQGVHAGRIPEPGAISAMPFDRFGAGAVSAAGLMPTVSAAMEDISRSPYLQQVVRRTAQIESTDQTIPALKAVEHQKEAVLAPSIVQATQSEPARIAEEASLAPAMTRIAGSIERVTSAEAARAAGSSSTSVGRVAGDLGTGAQPTLSGSALAAAQATRLNSQPRPVTESERQSLASIDDAKAQHESAASIATAAAMHNAATAAKRDSERSIAEAAAQHARGPSGVDANAWLKERQPPAPVNQVNVEEWIKGRQGVDSYWTSLKNLFTGARAGASDIHAATGATEGLAAASEHAAGAGGRVREGFVLLRELFRGDLTRGIGSATIELQRFGLLGLLVNPVVLSVGALAGALGYLAYKSSEIDANLRSFGSTVKVMGDGSLTSATELEKFTEQLKHTGVAGEDAKKTIQDIARSGFVRPGQSTADFASLARDISQYNTGGAEGTPAAAEGLLKAFGGTADEAVKFAESLHALGPKQIAAIHDLDQHGQSAEAFRRVYAALRATVPPFSGDLSEIQKALLGVKTTWDEFTTSLAKGDFPSLATSFIQEGINRLRTSIEEIEKLVHAVQSIKQTFTGGAANPEQRRDVLFPEYGPGSGNTAPYAEAAIPPRAPPAGVPTQEQVGNYLTGTLAFTPTQSAALVGQARAESTFNPGAENAGHRGMFQWDQERWGQLSAWAQLNGQDPLDYRTQLQFAKVEIQRRAPEFFTATSLPEQTSILTKKFEAPGNYGAEIPKRLGFAEQALSASPFRTPEGQSAQIDIANQKLKDQIAIMSQLPGVEREAAQERQRLQDVAAKTLPLGDQSKFIDQGMIGFWKNLATQFDTQHRLNDQQVSDTEKIARGYQQSAVEGLRAETLIQAQQEIRQRGGAPGEVTTAQRDIINQRAAAAISASRQQSTLAEPAIGAAEGLARASLVSRDEEERIKIANEAAAQTQNVLNLALLQGSEAYIKEAAAIDANARAQFRRREAAQQGLEAGHEIQRNSDVAQGLTLQTSLVGQGSIETERQLSYLRTQQEIAQRYSQASPQVQAAVAASGTGLADMNAQLAEAEQHQQRINELFHGIANTVDNELGNALRDALIRTPLEAGEHIKHYWQELRASLKATLADIVSGVAQAAFIKPLTSSIASAVGLGQVAQQIGGGFGGAAPTGSLGGRLAGGALSGSQIALNVSGVSSGGTLFGPAQGGTVNQSGNVTTVLGGAAGAASPTPPEQAAGPSAAAAAAASSAPAAFAQENATGPSVFFIPGTNTPITVPVGAAPSFSAAGPIGAPAQAAGAAENFVLQMENANQVAPSASILPQGAAATSQQTAATTGAPTAAPAAATASGLGSSISSIGSAVGLIDKLNTSLPGFLPSSLQSGGSLGGVGSFLSNPFGLFASPVSGGAPIGGIAGAPFSDTVAGPGVTAVPGIFGTTATFGSFLAGAGAGFGAGTLLNNALGGNPTGGTIGSAGGALAGAAIGAIFGPIGTALGGLIGGAAGGGLGGLIGGRPSGQSAGAVVGPSGQIAFNDTGGSAANINASTQVSQQISSFVRALGQLTNAAGQPIGNISTNAVVSSNNRTGINVTGSNISGGTFGQDAANAVTQTELQIVKSLTNVSGSLETVLQHINDPAQLQSAVQFVDVYDKLNVTSAELTANLNGNSNAIGPFSQALTQVNATFTQLTAQAQQFGVPTAPISAALDAVTKTVKQDFGINIAEALSTAIDGGNDFIASLVKIHQTFVQNTNDAKALATGVPTGVTGFAGGTMGSAGGTPPGWILVGERGPEWMLQPGGATVLPNGQQPSDVPDPAGRSFAQGTVGAGDIAGQLPGIGSAISEASGGPSLLNAAGSIAGISSDTLSTIGDALPIAGPLVGGLLGVVTGHPVQGAIGAAASLLGFAIGGPIGGVIGGLVGLLGNAIGPKPSNRASGDLVDLASGAISGFQSAGDKNADTVVAQISAGISAITKSFQESTGGTISGAVNVQDGKRDGIKTSYSGPQGNVDEKWGDVSSAIGQFGLAIAHNLQGIDPALQAQLSAINDPNQLISTIENFTGKGINLAAATPVAPAPSSSGAPSAPGGAVAASATGGGVGDATAMTPAVAAAVATAVASQAADNNAVSPQLALPSTPTSLDSGAAPPILSAPSDIAAAETQIAAERVQAQDTSLLTGVDVSSPVPAGYDPTAGGLYGQYDAYGTYIPATGTSGFATGSSGTPPGWILVGEKGPEWLLQPGGATVLPNGVLPPDVPSAAGRSFADGTLSTSGEINAAISGTETAQAGPVLATLGLDQLNTVIQSLGVVAPEIAAMAQNLISSGNALPDILTQGIQALTDPLDLAIEKEKATGVERVAIATQTGEDLVKAQQLTSANLVQAVLNNIGNTNALNAIVYPGNTKALETLQAAPTLAGLSGQQLSALASSISSVAPDIASLARNLIDTGTALPDTITQALEGIVNPLKLALQQQAAQSQARTQVADVTGQNFAQVAALNSASVIQAVISNISNPQALQALVANGNPSGLAQLQAGPVIAGLGTDQLSALLTAIGNAAPDLTNMINALTNSGRALPDALVQATQAITQAGVLAVEKAQALGFEQVQGAAQTGQSIPQAQQLAAAETAQAVAQATNTQLPINGLPDWVTQLEEAVTAPLQLAIQKERAAGAERVQIAQASGADLVRVQRENADAVAQIWYQATQQLTSLKNDLTTGSLSGLTAANQVTASIEQFNTVLGLVQGGNTNFISELSTAGQNAVQAAQQAYGNGPQTASVRQQVYQAISPFLVSASGYPTSGATAIAAGATTSGTATGATTDLQANTTALQSLTTAITSTLGSSGAITGGSGGTGVSGVSAGVSAGGTGGTSGFSPDLTASLDNLMSTYNALSPSMQAVYNGVVGSDNATFNNGAGLGNKVELASLLQGYQGLSPTASAQYDAAISNNPAYSNSGAGLANKLSLVESLYPPAAAPVTPVSPTAGSTTAAPANLNLTSNPVTGQSFTGSGITAVTPNFPIFPSASTLSNALADAIASRATASDWATINQAIQAGILDPTKQPGYALIIGQAQQWAAGQAIDPSAGLSQALSDAVHGTPSLQEWALINQAVNAGILSPTAQPQYATVIQQARKIANAQAVSLSQIPNNQTAYSTVINGRPAFAAGSESTPPGVIMVGEKGPEWYRPANDNMPWRMVGTGGPEFLSQPGGATILPFPVRPPQRFAEGTSDWRSGRYAWASGDSSGTTERVAQMLEKLRGDVVKELQASRKQLMGGQMADDQNARAGHELTRQLVRNTGPNLSAPARRAVG